ncbi:hypothetical protein AAVH_25353 [Aphelenchoides avenae]|nr:hypothetical protein AAVH_25353 [Aphelenchus avenae]
MVGERPSWTDEMVLRFITAVKNFPVLWEPTEATHTERYAAWEEVNKELPSFSVGELKDKWRYLKKMKKTSDTSWRWWGALDFLDAAHSEDALVARTSENGNESSDSGPGSSSSELRGHRSEPKEEVDSQENAVGPCAEYKWAVGVSKQDADDNEVLCDRIEINCVQSENKTDYEKEWTVDEEMTLCDAVKMHPVLWKFGDLDQLKAKWDKLRYAYLQSLNINRSRPYRLSMSMNFLDVVYTKSDPVVKTPNACGTHKMYTIPFEIISAEDSGRYAEPSSGFKRRAIEAQQSMVWRGSDLLNSQVVLEKLNETERMIEHLLRAQQQSSQSTYAGVICEMLDQLSDQNRVQAYQAVKEMMQTIIAQQDAQYYGDGTTYRL